MWSYCLSPSFTITKTKKYSIIEWKPIAETKEILTILDINCNYTNNIIYNLLQLRPWCKVISNINEINDKNTYDYHKTIQLSDFENIQWDNVLNGKHNASSYIIRKGLSRKAQFALQIKRFISKHSDSILKKCIPYTLIIETWNAFDEIKLDFGRGTIASFDSLTVNNISLRTRLEWCLDDIKQEFESKNRLDWIWILKPSVTNKGIGITIIDSWNKLLDITEESHDTREWVLQRYITNPLLINNHKFHLRVYVLCIGALQVYVYNNILMLLAAKKYNKSDLDNIHRHLTNTARAIEVENFNEELYIKLLDDLPEYIIKNYPHLSDSKESIKQKVLDQIYRITREIFTAYENEYTIFSPMSNCFELFGLDFIIDDQFNVYLLEINPGPDFKQTGDRLKQLITNLWNQTLSLVVDKEVYRLDDDYAYRDFTLVYDKAWSSSQFNGGMSLC